MDMQHARIRVHSVGVNARASVGTMVSTKVRVRTGVQIYSFC